MVIGERGLAFQENPNCPRRFVKPHARWAALTTRTGVAVNSLRIRRGMLPPDKDNPLQFRGKRATLRV